MLASEIHEIAPNSALRFLGYIQATYGVSSDDFNETPLVSQHREINKYFGYPAISHPEKSEKQLTKEIIIIFEEFESILIQYPFGVPDKLKMMKKMSSKEIFDSFEKTDKRIINHSLCDAICQISHFNRPSLKDALNLTIPLSQVKIVENSPTVSMKLDMFWEDIKLHPVKNETPPF